jgi:hypothetical protein
LKKTFLALLIISASISNAATYYVSTKGKDSNPGTRALPWRTLERLNSAGVNPGDTVYIRGGTYYSTKTADDENQTYLSGINGSSDHPIIIEAYPGEKVIFDFSNVLQPDNANKHGYVGLEMQHCTWTYWKNLRFTGVYQNKSGNGCANIHIYECDNTTFENIESDHGMTGFACENSNNVTYINCDAHDMDDPYTNGPTGAHNNSDGFSRTGDDNTSTNTIYRGCRAWWCSDDGWDCFNTNGLIIYDGCWAFWNGYLPGTTQRGGDGNGFKMGGGKTHVTGGISRFLRNCIAFQNRANGFDQNAATFIAEVYNNTAYENGQWGFAFSYINGLSHILKNNISYKNIKSDVTSPQMGWIQSNNSWNGFKITESDFTWLKPTGVAGPRRTNGDLPGLQFLTLAKSSKLIDAGTDIGTLYKGKAPDIGAYELR